INKNFDASYEKKEDKYDILLATDKISEGFNLNRAGMVINYDIPWNPVRVIQRLGRINRISKKVFDELYIVNFFPTEKGAELVRSRQIAENKMFLIHNALGEDSKIFDIDEEPSPSELFNRVNRNPDETEEESFYTKVLREYLKIKEENPDIEDILNDFPPRVKVAKAGNENELLVFFKKGRMYVTASATDIEKPQPYYTSFEDVFDRVKCLPDEKALNWSSDIFWKTYDAIKEFKDVRTTGKVSEQSLETKAHNNLMTLIREKNDKLTAYKGFLRMLKEDIENYGTLADYTLRRIAGFKSTNTKDIEELQNELGKDYLAKEKERIKDLKKEIIIAVENKKL
ncbi:MAG: helicase-related protein, partial [Armatimonadota bacterium]